MPLNTREQRSRVLVLLVATALVFLVWAVFVLTYAGQRLDAASYGGAFWLQAGHWRLIEAARARLVLPGAALVTATAIALLLARRMWWRAAVTLGLAAGAMLTIQVLKRRLLDRPDLGFPPDVPSLPSGHTGAVAVACAALVIAVPRAWRGATALAGSWVTALAGAAALVGHQHRPSDMVASVLVVLAWAAAAAVLIAWRDGDGLDKPSPGPRERRTLPGFEWAMVTQGAALTGLAVLAAALVLILPAEPISPFRSLLALLSGLAAIAATSSIAFAAMSALLRGPGEPARLGTPRVSRARGSAS